MKPLATFLPIALTLVCAAPAIAAPITPTLQGCVSSLAPGAARWQSSEHFQMVAFWDPTSGCNPTIAVPIVLHEWIENFNGTGGLLTVAHPELFPACGRIQFDAHSYMGVTGELDPLGLVSLVFDTGVDCVLAAGGTGSGAGNVAGAGGGGGAVATAARVAAAARVKAPAVAVAAPVVRRRRWWRWRAAVAVAAVAAAAAVAVAVAAPVAMVAAAAALVVAAAVAPVAAAGAGARCPNPRPLRSSQAAWPR